MPFSKFLDFFRRSKRNNPKEPHPDPNEGNVTADSCSNNSGDQKSKEVTEQSDESHRTSEPTGADDSTSQLEFVAMYDYEPRTELDLPTNVGELFFLLNDDHPDWWYMRNLFNGLEGYVPSNYVADARALESHRWYFGTTRRIECKRMLCLPNTKDGTFLVRSSETRPDEYSLSMLHEGKVRHYRIRGGDDGFYINSDVRFISLPKLVEFYVNNDGGLCTRLTDPCMKREIPTTAGMSHNTNLQWEIPREEITLIRRLGSGNFGEVYEAAWNTYYKVAVKTMKEGAMCKEDFLAEAQFLKTLRHPKLLQLFAVCTLEEPLYIITELMDKGSLLDYLRGEGSSINLETQVDFGAQVASGMAYLEAKNYIHRDLAARNVLVGLNHVVKVADFGLTRLVNEEEYEAKVGAKFPVKWTAPEAINYHKFSVKSDVWSFGVLMYEILTHGAKPYPGMSNPEVATVVDQGYRLPSPKDCPSLLYNIMMTTWNKDPIQRPTFSTLEWQLADFFSLDHTDYRELNL